MKIKNLFSTVLADLKVSAQTKTFWVSLLGTLILIGQFTWVTFLGGAMPSGVDGGLVTVGNAVISLLIAAGLIKNTDGEDLTAKQVAKEKEQADALLNSLGVDPDELKMVIAQIKSQPVAENKEEPKNEA